MKYPLPSDTPQGQKDAITADNKSITVGAGAGTGKTWVLTERYTRLLMEDSSLKPNEILTLTYTEAAAGEMKARITKRVEEVMDDFPDNDRRNEILDGLADIWISTIHSFAARLIRESGLSLDIDPLASVITTQQENDFWDSIAQAAEFGMLSDLAKTYGDKRLKRYAEELDRDEYFAYAVAAWRSGNLSSFARATAELHASSGRSWEEMLRWLDNDELLESGKKRVKDILLPEWREVWEIFSRLPVLPMPKTKKPDSVGVIFNNMLASYLGQKADDDIMQGFYTDIVQAKGGTGQPFTTLKEHLGDTFGNWRNSRPKAIREITPDFDSPLTEQELAMRRTLLKFCALSWAMWDNMKQKRGLLSFSDMINHARKAIEDGAVTRKFRHILVDEFQDTDWLQNSMIHQLVNDNTGLFAVGDPKQSIYRFRHADPALFAETIRDSERNIELDTCFRTRDELLRIINRLFANIWLGGLGKSPAMSGLTYKHVNPITSGTERDSGTMPVFMVILAPHGQSTLAQGRQNLADELARNIHDWVESGLTVWDKKDRLIRPVKYSDFAVLAPARSIYPVIEEALAKFGIKSIQDKSTDYFARVEINDVVCLLRAASDMNDDFAVTGWLLSPFSGVDESEALKVLARADKKTRPIDIIRQHFPGAYSRLEYYALVGEHEGPAGLIEIFDRDRRWLSCYRAGDRMRVLRNIRLAVSVARDFQRSGTATLVSCAEWLTRTVHNGVDFEEPAWHDDSENAVRLGTVHSAKGLEYPVAVVFDPRKQKKYDTYSLRPSRELGLVFTKFPDEIAQDDMKPKLAAWEKLLSEQGEEEEQTRLFYVAATRAQDSLIFCGMIDENTQEPHDHTWTKLLLKNEKVDNPVIAHELPPHVFPDLGSDDAEESLRPVSVVKAENALRQISASSFALYEWCPFAWRRSYMQGRTLTWDDPAEKAEDYDGYSGGAELGSLVHWILSRWPEDGDYESRLDYYLHDKEALSHMSGSLRAAWRKNDNDKDSHVKEWLMRFADSELGRMMRTRKDIKREYRFRLPLDECTSLAGSIDAFYDNTIIDYKTTEYDKNPSGMYDSQLDFYALVAHELTGADSVNTQIVFLREGRTEERVITDFDAVRERVKSAARICALGPYVPRHENCGLCPFKKGCAKYADVQH